VRLEVKAKRQNIYNAYSSNANGRCWSSPQVTAAGGSAAGRCWPVPGCWKGGSVLRSSKFFARTA